MEYKKIYRILKLAAPFGQKPTKAVKQQVTYVRKDKNEDWKLQSFADVSPVFNL